MIAKRYCRECKATILHRRTVAYTNGLPAPSEWACLHCEGRQLTEARTEAEAIGASLASVANR